MSKTAAALLRDIGACTTCANFLPMGPRPIIQFSATSSILVIGQAPGTKVHASGVPWQDDSGDRLREWLGIGKADFYDASKVALVPMGFCYPGRRPGGDAPPRPECAPRWHERVLNVLPTDRLTVLVGTYAQEYYLPKDAGRSLLERVREYRRFAPVVIPDAASFLAQRAMAETESMVREGIASHVAPRGPSPVGAESVSTPRLMHA